MDPFIEMAQAEQDMFRKAMGLPDWHYRDLPNLSTEFFDEFVAMVGTDNLRWITLAERRWPDDTITKRGQVMISPDGMARIAAHNAAIADTHAKRGDVKQAPSLMSGGGAEGNRT